MAVKARVAIRHALGHHAGLEGAAEIQQAVVAKFAADIFKQHILIAALVTTAGNHRNATHPELPGMNANGHAGLLPKGALARHRKITQFPHGHMHHAQHRTCALDQRDIHAEFAVALEELLGTVEGIDNPAARPLMPRRQLIFSGLFRHHRNIRRQRAQAGCNQRMRRHVGSGERRGISLLLNIPYAVVGVDGHDGAASGLGNGNDRLHQTHHAAPSVAARRCA